MYEVILVRDTLIKELNELLELAETRLNALRDEVSDTRTDDLVHALFYLNNKDIPAQICSETKLMERILEVGSLLKEIELTFHDDLRP